MAGSHIARPLWRPAQKYCTPTQVCKTTGQRVATSKSKLINSWHASVSEVWMRPLCRKSRPTAR